jgi:gamma-glutamyltranspeptidase/glutathione hydrolase
VLDGNGVGVSLIQSNFQGIGSGVGAGGAGFLLHDRGLGFTLTPGHPGELAPGRRPLHTLSPTLWTRDGRLALLLGTRGGHVQPQVVTHLAAALLGAGVDPAAAQAGARWTALSEAESSVRVEPDTPAAVIDGLRRRGHDVAVMPEPQSGWGPVSMIQVHPDGQRASARDPRVPTTAVMLA